VVTPPVERYLLAKCHLSSGLIVAGIVAGVTKILNAFSKASVSALATQRELAMVNYLGWVSVVLAVVAGLAAGTWGLAGVIYGVALGWLLRAIAAFYVTFRHLRLPAAAVAAPTPAP
jgi:Na+-driven multidrug efflux pump